MSNVVAVDVGGTFTDIVVVDLETGEARFGKVPTVPSAPAEGVLAAFAAMDVDLSQVESFLHGTTIGLNALLEHRTRRVGVITTRGFRDVLEIARMSWPMYRLHWDQPEPLVPRSLRYEVDERVLADGTIDRPLVEEDVRTAARALAAQGIETIAVCLLHAYVRADHEKACAEILRDELPGVAVSLSHEVSSEYREYERTATTVVDAMLRPIIGTYLQGLEDALRGQGFGGAFYVTRCDGGVMSVEEARSRSIRTLVSGPASGIMGAAALARLLGRDRVIACDMGGTSFDAALILDGEPDLESITHVEGIPLLMPVVAMTAVGTGGGSIAWIDEGGALNLGPQSAGADPGPVSYGRGGERVTFTDASVTCGLIDPDYFLGGEVRLDAPGAHAAIATTLDAPLGLDDVVRTATGIVELAESKMAAALESITVERGVDPRDFVLIAYGGGGPLAAGGLARRLGIPVVIVPESPGTFSARGMTSLDLVHDLSMTSITREGAIVDTVREQFAALDAAGLQALEREGVAPEARELVRFVDARYENQEHTITLPLPAEGALDAAEIRAQFDELHESLYAYRMPDPIEVVTYRLRAIGRRSVPIARSLAAAGDPTPVVVKGTRTASHPATGRDVAWTVLERASLEPGQTVAGPAIVEEPSATTLVHAGQTMEIDAYGNVVVSETPAR